MTVDLSWLATYRSSSPILAWSEWEPCWPEGKPTLSLSRNPSSWDQWKRIDSSPFTVFTRAKDCGLVFSPPYLVSFHEQISINGLPISDQDLETYLSLYQDYLQTIVLIRPY